MMRNLQQIRIDFQRYLIHPIDWLGDSPSRFDLYTELSQGCESILELGVYSGLSTVAFLLSNPKKIRSIDITSEYFKIFNEVDYNAKILNIDYQFIVMDDLNYISDGHDLLFIDTSHSYEHTLAELNRFGQNTRKKIILHDVSSFFGVYQSVFQWLWENKNFHITLHDTRGDGVIVLERLFGI